MFCYSQLLDLLEPGCNGVIKSIAQIPLKNYKQAFEFIVDVGNKYYEGEMEGGDWEEDFTSPDEEQFDGYGQEQGGDHWSEGGGDHELPDWQKRDEL